MTTLMTTPGLEADVHTCQGRLRTENEIGVHGNEYSLSKSQNGVPLELHRRRNPDSRQVAILRQSVQNAACVSLLIPVRPQLLQRPGKQAFTRDRIVWFIVFRLFGALTYALAYKTSQRGPARNQSFNTARTNQAINASTTLPCTSVRRKSRPA